MFLWSGGCHDAGEGRFEGTSAFLQGFSSSAYRKRAIRELQTLSTSAQISFILVGIRDRVSASAFLLSQLSTLHDQHYSVRDLWQTKIGDSSRLTFENLRIGVFDCGIWSASTAI